MNRQGEPQHNWDDLRFILALARTGSLSAAAKRLLVSHTTVARRVAGFEDHTGVRLFDQTPTGFVPTDAGRELIEIADRIEGEIATIDRNVIGRDTRLSGELRITTLDILALACSDTFADFSDRYPDIELNIAIDNAFRSLNKREADIALRATSTPPENLVGRRVGRFDYAPYLSRSLLAELGDEWDRSDLSALPWIGWDEAAGARMTATWMRRHVPSARISARVGSAVVMLACMSAGMGAQFIPTVFGEREPALVRVGELEPSFSVDLWLLTHPDLRGTARVRAFMDFAGPAIAARLPTELAPMFGDPDAS